MSGPSRTSFVWDSRLAMPLSSSANGTMTSTLCIVRLRLSDEWPSLERGDARHQPAEPRPRGLDAVDVITPRRDVAEQEVGHGGAVGEQPVAVAELGLDAAVDRIDVVLGAVLERVEVRAIDHLVAVIPPVVGAH